MIQSSCQIFKCQLFIVLIIWINLQLLTPCTSDSMPNPNIHDKHSSRLSCILAKQRGASDKSVLRKYIEEDEAALSGNGYYAYKVTDGEEKSLRENRCVLSSLQQEDGGKMFDENEAGDVEMKAYKLDEEKDPSPKFYLKREIPLAKKNKVSSNSRDHKNKKPFTNKNTKN